MKKSIFTMTLIMLILLINGSVGLTQNENELKDLQQKVKVLQSTHAMARTQINLLKKENQHLTGLVDSLKNVQMKGEALVMAVSGEVSSKTGLITVLDKRVNDLSQALEKRKNYTLGGSFVLLIFMVILLILLNMLRKRTALLEQHENMDIASLQNQIKMLTSQQQSLKSEYEDKLNSRSDELKRYNESMIAESWKEIEQKTEEMLKSFHDLTLKIRDIETHLGQMRKEKE